MKIDEMERGDWREFLNKLDEQTGLFRDSKIVCIMNNELVFVSDKISSLEPGCEPVSYKFLLEKALKVLNREDLDLAKKIGVLLARTIFEVELNEYQRELEELTSLCESELVAENQIFRDGRKIQLENFLNRYKLYLTPETTASLQELMNKMADAYIANKQTDESLKIRLLQLNNLNFSLIPEILKESDRWSSAEGAYQDGTDSGQIKQGTLHFLIQRQGPKNVYCLDFKLTYPERDLLEHRIASLRISSLNCYDYSRSFFKDGIEINEVKYKYYSRLETDVVYPIGIMTQIEFKGVGRVQVGKSQIIGSLYNRIKVEIDRDISKEAFLIEARQMLVFLGLGGVYDRSSSEAEERKKLMVIFRTFYPRDAYSLEEKIDTYSISAEKLKNEMVMKNPEAEQTIQKYLTEKPELVVKEDVYCGKSVYAITDLADQMRTQGAVCLFSGVNAGAKSSDVADIVLKILSNGLLSSQDRFDQGIIVSGASSIQDHGANSADQVFCRLITKSSLDRKRPVSGYPLSGKIQILIELEVLNRGGYMHTSDCYGEKNRKKLREIKKFQERLNPLEFTTKVEDQNLSENEVMIKNRIPSTFFRGILVPDQEHKDAIVTAIISSNFALLVDDCFFYNGVKIDDFVKISSVFSSDCV